jgi:hypothetical protein
MAGASTNDLDHWIRLELVSLLTGGDRCQSPRQGEAWSNLLSATRTLARFHELDLKDRQLRRNGGRWVGTNFDFDHGLRT